MSHPAPTDDDTLVFITDLDTGDPALPPGEPVPDVLAALLADAKTAHAVLLAREASVIERQHRVAQLWLAAAALCATAGLLHGAVADWWLAFGFACGFSVSVLLLGPQGASLPGYALSDFNDPWRLADAQTPSTLLSTWQEVIARSEKAVARRVWRFAVSVWLLALYTPLAILSRIAHA